MTDDWWTKPITEEERRARAPLAQVRRTKNAEAMIAKGLHPFGMRLRDPYEGAE